MPPVRRERWLVVLALLGLLALFFEDPLPSLSLQMYRAFASSLRVTSSASGAPLPVGYSRVLPLDHPLVVLETHLPLEVFKANLNIFEGLFIAAQM